MLNVDSSLITLAFILISIAIIYGGYRIFLVKPETGNQSSPHSASNYNLAPIERNCIQGSSGQMFNYQMISCARNRNQRAKNQKRLRGHGKK